jgi:hypothetical protein
MTFHEIEDERDLYEKYTNHLRELTKLEISIHGASDEEKTQIKDTLQELLTTEVIDRAHEKLRAGGVRDELLKHSRRDLRRTLKGLPLPEKDQRIVEAKVRRLARQMTPSSKVLGPEASAGPPLEPPMLRASPA